MSLVSVWRPGIARASGSVSHRLPAHGRRRRIRAHAGDVRGLLKSLPPTDVLRARASSPPDHVVYESEIAMPKIPSLPWGPDLRLFADTSSLMEPGSATCFEALVPQLRQHGLKLIVPERVIGELRQMTGARESLAAEGLKIITKLGTEDVVDLRGEQDDGYVDNLFQAVFVRFRLRYDLVLITQDRALAQDILALNDANAVQRIRGIQAMRAAPKGFQIWNANGVQAVGTRSQGGGAGNPGPGSGGATSAPRVDPGLWPLVPVSTALEPVRAMLSAGDTVQDGTGRAHRLTKLLGTGGEGSAFETDTGLVCKVFLPERCFRSRLDKIELMANNPVNHPAICWPLSVARSGPARIGYLMPKAHGRELQKSVFVKPLLLRFFPTWKKDNLVRLALTILDPIATLNAQGILIGDINPRNVLVASDRQVFIVDTDSFQFRGYPCRVGMPPFLAPELYGKDLSSTLRTRDHEAFAVSTLVFMLMLPGKPPYSHQGGEDPAKNVKKGKFPYAVGEKKGKDVPEGPWRYQFSHLPRYMKEQFDRVFSKGDWMSAEAWQGVLTRYQNDLAAGFVSNELFPTGLKELSREQTEKAGGEWVRCNDCGKEFGYFGDHTRPLCRSCLNSMRERREAREAAQSAQARPAGGGQGRKSSGPSPQPRPSPSGQRPSGSPPKNRPPVAQPDDPITALFKWFFNLFS
jgi:serine/threonine protein kinase